jgi:putative PIG3 family NAD(P)H quinone oxidoreductase
MRVIEIKARSLLSATRPMPELSENQVLIKVYAAGVNRADVMQRKGHYPPSEGASDIPGLEVAGIVVAKHENIDFPKIGDKVCALLTGGGYAQYCLASCGSCLPIPDGLSFIEAAALPEAFFTVWSNIFDRAHLQTGETLLVHGGSSGIGTTAIQLARAFGSNVIITAGSDDKCNACLKLGASLAINYRQQDFVEAVMNHTRQQGVNVILDMIGGDYFHRNIQCLALDGRLVQIAVQKSHKPEIDLLTIMQKRLFITGSTLRSREDAFKTEIAKKLYKNVWHLLASGKIKPMIHSAFPLNDAMKAHELMESSQHIGKIILEV